jgi:predicted negative regulator of RcsB-dependent stress response
MLGGSALWLFAKNLFGSPMGRAVLLLSAFLAWTAYQRHDAAASAVAAYQVRVNAVAEAEYQRQLAVAASLAQEARDRATASEARATSMEAQRDAIIEDLQAAPAGDCPIPDDVRQRLLGIGG